MIQQSNQSGWRWHWARVMPFFVAAMLTGVAAQSCAAYDDSASCSAGFDVEWGSCDWTGAACQVACLELDSDGCTEYADCAWRDADDEQGYDEECYLNPDCAALTIDNCGSVPAFCEWTGAVCQARSLESVGCLDLFFEDQCAAAAGCAWSDPIETGLDFGLCTIDCAAHTDESQCFGIPTDTLLCVWTGTACQLPCGMFDSVDACEANGCEFDFFTNECTLPNAGCATASFEGLCVEFGCEWTGSACQVPCSTYDIDACMAAGCVWWEDNQECVAIPDCAAFGVDNCFWSFGASDGVCWWNGFVCQLSCHIFDDADVCTANGCVWAEVDAYCMEPQLECTARAPSTHVDQAGYESAQYECQQLNCAWSSRNSRNWNDENYCYRDCHSFTAPTSTSCEAGGCAWDGGGSCMSVSCESLGDNPIGCATVGTGELANGARTGCQWTGTACLVTCQEHESFDECIAATADGCEWRNRTRGGSSCYRIPECSAVHDEVRCQVAGCSWNIASGACHYPCAVSDYLSASDLMKVDDAQCLSLGGGFCGVAWSQCYETFNLPQCDTFADDASRCQQAAACEWSGSACLEAGSMLYEDRPDTLALVPKNFNDADYSRFGNGYTSFESDLTYSSTHGFSSNFGYPDEFYDLCDWVVPTTTSCDLYFDFGSEAYMECLRSGGGGHWDCAGMSPEESKELEVSYSSGTLLSHQCHELAVDGILAHLGERQRFCATTDHGAACPRSCGRFLPPSGPADHIASEPGCGGRPCFSCTLELSSQSPGEGECADGLVLNHTEDCVGGCGDSGSWSVTACDNGTVQTSACCAPGSELRNVECAACAGGYYDHDADARTPCNACSAGMFSSPGSLTCDPCPAQTDSSPGSAACGTCGDSFASNYDPAGPTPSENAGCTYTSESVRAASGQAAANFYVRQHDDTLIRNATVGLATGSCLAEYTACQSSERCRTEFDALLRGESGPTRWILAPLLECMQSAGLEAVQQGFGPLPAADTVVDRTFRVSSAWLVQGKRDSRGDLMNLGFRFEMQPASTLVLRHSRISDRRSHGTASPSRRPNTRGADGHTYTQREVDAGMSLFTEISEENCCTNIGSNIDGRLDFDGFEQNKPLKREPHHFSSWALMRDGHKLKRRCYSDFRSYLEDVYVPGRANIDRGALGPPLIRDVGLPVQRILSDGSVGTDTRFSPRDDTCNFCACDNDDRCKNLLEQATGPPGVPDTVRESQSAVAEGLGPPDKVFACQAHALCGPAMHCIHALSGRGGAIRMIGATADISYSALTDNQASELGGAIYAAHSTVSVANTEISRNSAVAGGAIVIYMSTLSLSQVVLADNLADGCSCKAEEGGCYTGQDDQLSSRTDGSPRTRGGDPTEVYESALTCGPGSNIFDGGGIYSMQSTMSIANSALLSNNAQRGGGNHIYGLATQTLYMYNVSLSPFNPIGGASINAGGALGGCATYPCDPGYSCTYAEYSLLCTPCVPPTVGLDGISCTTCSPGYEPSADRSSCQPCTTDGTFSQFGAQCVQCAAGKYTTDSISCVDCPPNQVQEAGEVGCSCAEGYYNARAVTPTCYGADWYDAGGRSELFECASCDFLSDCVAECRGEWFDIRPGWTVSSVAASPTQLGIFQCKAADACPGGSIERNSTSCAVGYGSALCGACNEAYTLNPDGTCEECGETSAASVALGIIVATVVLFLMARYAKQFYTYFVMLQSIAQAAKDLELKSIAKVIVATFQILGNLDGVLKLKMPEVFSAFSRAFVGWFKFDISEVFKLGCLSAGSYISGLSSQVIAVVLVSGAVTITYLFQVRKARASLMDDDDEDSKEMLRELFASFDTDGEGIKLDEVQIIMKKVDPELSEDEIAEQSTALFGLADTDHGGTIDFQEFHNAVIEGNKHPDMASLDLGRLVRKKQAADIRDQATGRAFLLVFLLYPGLTNKIFEAFACRVVGNEAEVLMIDYTIDCLSSEYWMLVVVAILLMVLWSFGLPTVLFWSMYKERDLIMLQDEDTVQKFDFVLQDYRHEYWYWEVIELGRKLCLSGLVGLFQRGSIAQTVLATAVSFGFFALTAACRPFNTTRLNIIKIVTEIQIFGILLVCIVLQTAPESGLPLTEVVTIEDYGRVQVFLSVAVFPITLYFLVTGLKEVKEHVKEIVGDEETDNPVFEVD